MNYLSTLADVAQQAISDLLKSDLSHELKMEGLAELEKSIGTLYDIGLTHLKPVSKMSSLDLVS